MARPPRIDAKIVKRAQLAAAQATSVQELRAAQAVLLPAQTGITLAQTGALLGVGRATVVRLQGRFRRMRSGSPLKTSGWGGRRNALMTLAEERAFLAPWLEQATAGGLVVVSPVRAALAQKLGQPVKPSVVYRLLARHGWRKVAPDTRHPKSDPAVQAAWGRNSRKLWRPWPNPPKCGAAVCG